MRKLLLALAISTSIVTPVFAEFKLDQRYQDADGDMIADWTCHGLIPAP